MDRLTQTSENGGVALTFDLDVTCEKSEILKILKMAEKLKMYEDMEEKIEKEIDDIVKSENYPHFFTGQTVEVLEWVLSLLTYKQSEENFNEIRN